MGVAMKQFIDRFKAMEKIANETLAENPEALVGVDSFPGSEHDAKVPEEAKKPDEEVLQGQPADAASTAGATNGGDAKPLNEGKLEIDEPLLNPEQKPLVTDDALTAKTANAHLSSIVQDLLKDLKGGTQKQAAAAQDQAVAAQKQAVAAQKKEERTKIMLDRDTISKIAEAQAAFSAGRETANRILKQASAVQTPNAARELIKAACVKAAQEQGLDPASAAAAADNAMAAAGMAPEVAAPEVAAPEVAAPEAAAPEAAAPEAAELPEDVTEEELATAIVDLVSSGELDPNTAKALVEEIAGEDAGAAPSEDQAAEIIAQDLESGEITPEQAEEIAAAVEGGAAEGAEGAEAAEAAEGAEEAQGAADAEAAIQDAQDEAQGAADAEAAIKSAAAAVRADAINKVSARVAEKRASDKARPGSRILAKVASILESKVSEKKAEAQRTDSKYIAGFKKRAEELGVDPSALARYVCERQAK